MDAHAILKKAGQHMSDRAVTHDKPNGERSIRPTVRAFKAVTGISLTEEQGCLFMALLKAVRSQQGEYNADDYQDGAAYFALAGEAAAVERMPMEEARLLIQEAAKERTDGWIKHDGTSAAKCGPRDMVIVRYRDGHESKVVLANALNWQHSADRRSLADIITYKVVE